jgi:hypothetical protein
VEWTELDGVVGRSIDAVEGDTEKALLLGKLDSFQICNAVARGFAAASCARSG